VKEIMSIKTSKKENCLRRYQRKLGKFFASEGSVETKKEHKRRSYCILIVLATSPQELITRDHGKSIRRTSLRCGIRRSGLPARLTATL
jgi:hypothetical protein